MAKQTGMKITALLICVWLAAALMGCTPSPAETTGGASAVLTEAETKPAESADTASTPNAQTAGTSPKYIFLFIGDGMSFAQVQAAQVYKGSVQEQIDPGFLNFTLFPVVGTAATYDATSYIPDSAAAGTAIACGVKTQTGTIGMAADDVTAVQSIAELLKADGKKIGIVTSTSLNHATPAAFYAHADSRGDYYDIALQMAGSGFDYFGGGGIYQPTGSGGDQVSAYTVLEQSGYVIADTQEEIKTLSSATDKAYAVSPMLQGSEMLPFAIDAQEGDLVLADYVRKGIDVLDGEDGFFMMCEGGKIDPACHANDAATAIQEVLGFGDAVQEAVNFMAEHPDETLIVVTADHETGGMALGYTLTQYDTSFEVLQAQSASYFALTEATDVMREDNAALRYEDVLPVIGQYFGMGRDSAACVLTDEDEANIKAALEELNNPGDTAEAALEYGSYNPLTVTLTHILSGRAGIGWSTWYHTAALVPVYAAGAGAELFSGSYDNTDLFGKLKEICYLP